MKSEYRLLCNDQHPVKDLSFGTELGKSVNDLTEASKVYTTPRIFVPYSQVRKRSISFSMKHSMQRNQFCKVRIHCPTNIYHWQAVSDFTKINARS